MKVGQLRDKIISILYTLKEYPDDSEIKLQSNTYFVNGNKYFLGVSGYNGGYVGLDNIEESIIINNEQDN